MCPAMEQLLHSLQVMDLYGNPLQLFYGKNNTFIFVPMRLGSLCKAYAKGCVSGMIKPFEATKTWYLYVWVLLLQTRKHS